MVCNLCRSYLDDPPTADLSLAVPPPGYDLDDPNAQHDFVAKAQLLNCESSMSRSSKKQHRSPIKFIWNFRLVHSWSRSKQSIRQSPKQELKAERQRPQQAFLYTPGRFYGQGPADLKHVLRGLGFPALAYFRTLRPHTATPGTSMSRNSLHS